VFAIFRWVKDDVGVSIGVITIVTCESHDSIMCTKDSTRKRGGLKNGDKKKQLL
jgi:hypothetical protein